MQVFTILVSASWFCVRVLVVLCLWLSGLVRSVIWLVFCGLPLGGFLGSLVLWWLFGVCDDFVPGVVWVVSCSWWGWVVSGSWCSAFLVVGV